MRRVMHAGESDKHEIALHFLSLDLFRQDGIEIALCGTEHAQRLCGQHGVLRGDFGTICVRELADAFSSGNPGAKLQQKIGRAIDERTVTAIRHPTDDALTFAVGIEGSTSRY